MARDEHLVTAWLPWDLAEWVEDRIIDRTFEDWNHAIARCVTLAKRTLDP